MQTNNLGGKDLMCFLILGRPLRNRQGANTVLDKLSKLSSYKPELILFSPYFELVVHNLNFYFEQFGCDNSHSKRLPWQQFLAI